MNVSNYMYIVIIFDLYYILNVFVWESFWEILIYVYINVLFNENNFLV